MSIRGLTPRQRRQIHEALADFDRDYRGESFDPSDEDRDPLTTISSSGGTASALERISRRGSGAGVRERARQRRQKRKYAQHAVMMLSNPTLPAAERQRLTSSLRRAGAPVGPGYTPGFAASASAFGPGMLPSGVGLVGSRRGLSGARDKDEGYAQIVSVWRPKRREYDYYRVPHGITLRPAPPPKGKPAFGEALEAMLPALPRASYKIGSGAFARGRMVVERKKRLPSFAAMFAVGLDKLEDRGMSGWRDSIPPAPGAGVLFAVVGSLAVIAILAGLRGD